MLAIGILYLVFDSRILGSSENISPFSRVVIGAQTGLVALAMATTWSSITSIQAKQGLPIGTQVVGWATFGMCVLSAIRLTTNFFNSSFAYDTLFA